MNHVQSTVNQFVQRHPAYTKGGLRWMIFNEKTNGLAEAGAVLRVGRKVVIDEERFFRWVDEQNGINTEAA